MKLLTVLISLWLIFPNYSFTLAASPKVEQSEEDEPEVEGEPTAGDNPFLETNLDSLVDKKISDDVWEQMKGELPCVTASTECLNQLQSLAIQNSRILKEIDTRVEEANAIVLESRQRNQDSIAISTFSPFLQAYFNSALPPSNPSGNQLVNNPFNLIFGNLTATLLGQGLSALFPWQTQSANDSQQARAIAIGDIQIKIAELQRQRAELVNKIREKVVLEGLKLEQIARNFQIAQEIAKREKARLQIIKINYQFGESDSLKYLSDLSFYDRRKAETWREWSKLRSQITLVKMLVTNPEEN
jgi:hypothetical protein